MLFPLPIAIVALASGPHWWTAFLLGLTEFLSGLGVMLFDVNLNSLQAAVIPDDMRSRVAGAFSTINYGIRPLGAVIGGAARHLRRGAADARRRRGRRRAVRVLVVHLADPPHQDALGPLAGGCCAERNSSAPSLLLGRFSHRPACLEDPPGIRVKGFSRSDRESRMQVVRHRRLADVALVAIALFGRAIASIVAVVRTGQPVAGRRDRPGTRWVTMFRETLGHTRMLQWSAVGAAHWFVFVGFGLLFFTLVTAFGQLFDPYFQIWLLGSFFGYEWAAEAVTWLMIVAIVGFIGYRLTRPRERERGAGGRFSGSRMWQGYFVEARHPRRRPVHPRAARRRVRPRAVQLRPRPRLGLPLPADLLDRRAARGDVRERRSRT